MTNPEMAIGPGAHLIAPSAIESSRAEPASRPARAARHADQDQPRRANPAPVDQQQPGQHNRDHRPEPAPGRVPERRGRETCRRTGDHHQPPVGGDHHGVRAARRDLHGDRSDPADLIQFIDRSEAALRITELNDLLGRNRSDPVDLLELFLCRRAETDRNIRSPGGSARADRSGRSLPAAAGRWNHHLLAVGQGRRPVDRTDHRTSGCTPGPVDRVNDPGTMVKAVDAGAPDRSGDIDDQLAAAGTDLEAAGSLLPGAGSL